MKAAPSGASPFGASNASTDADTGPFAVGSVRRWWNTMGSNAYPDASRLLITTDSGASNGSRLRLWQTELAEFAVQTGLRITVCHLPPGASKCRRIKDDHVRLEEDRAQAVLRDQPELAGTTLGVPRSQQGPATPGSVGSAAVTATIWVAATSSLPW